MVLGLAAACHAAAAEPRSIDDAAGAEHACRVALANGQPLEAAQAIQDLPPGPVRQLLRARIALALGEPQQALSWLGATSPEGLVDLIPRWEATARGEAAQVAAETALAAGAPRWVAPLVALAEREGGEAVEPDRCTALRMQAALALHDAATAEAQAAVLWHTGVRSPYRSRAGLVLAQALATTQPAQARDILAVIRSSAPVGPVRLAAAELLCAVLLPIHPGECAAVAGDEIGRIVAVGGKDVGSLPRWQALALARIDPAAGQRALRTLPASLADDPLVAQALAAPATHTEGVDLVRERALLQAGIGDVAGARRLLTPVASADPASLALLLSLPGSQPQAWANAPAAHTPEGAAAVAEAWMAVHADAAAWAAIAPFAAHPQAPEAVLAAAARCAPDAAARRQLRSRLFAIAVRGAAVGQAWCDEAEDRQARGLDATAAWSEAARALPADHPYQAEAAWRAARLLTAVGRQEEALALLDGPAAWSADTPACCRCRFLLAQIWFQRGNRAAALRAARSLRGLGDAGQAQRLEALIASIESLPSSR